MNFNSIRYIISRIMIAEAALLVIPSAVAVIYGEYRTLPSFLITAALLVILGFALGFRAPRDGDIYARDGMVAVALSWIVMSLFGALPAFISGEIPSYIDSLFETISGFTTTGASILAEIEKMSQGMLFWRSFTHWIGGMGVLVFVMAILPMSGGRNMHIMRAEVPGPEVGKLVAKMSTTAKLLYGIYFVMTAVEVVMLVCGGMPLFDALIHSFGSAGTGGFSNKALSVGAYNSTYIEMIVAVFMVLFGVNFNIYYLVLLKNFRAAFRSEELRAYLGIISVSTVAIAVNLLLRMNYGIGRCLRYSFFQVSSIMTTTGFASTDFEQWPEFSRVILVILMFIGASAGSTGGGIKVARVVILFKSSLREMKRMMHPHAVTPVRFEGKPLDIRTLHSTSVFFSVYMIVFTASVLLVSLDHFDLITTFTAVASCMNNIGPGLSLVGPMGNFSGFSDASKLLLSLNMLIGRLEIFPILMIFAPSVWKRGKNRAKLRNPV